MILDGGRLFPRCPFIPGRFPIQPAAASSACPFPRRPPPSMHDMSLTTHTVCHILTAAPLVFTDSTDSSPHQSPDSSRDRPRLPLVAVTLTRHISGARVLKNAQNHGLCSRLGLTSDLMHGQSRLAQKDPCFASALDLLGSTRLTSLGQSRGSIRASASKVFRFDRIGAANMFLKQITQNFIAYPIDCSLHESKNTSCPTMVKIGRSQGDHRAPCPCVGLVPHSIIFLRRHAACLVCS